MRSAVSAFDECLRDARDSAQVQRLYAARPEVERMGAELIRLGEAARLCDLRESEGCGAAATAGDMEWLYRVRMVSRGASGRVVYEEIMMLAPNGRCPYCGHSVATTLDHFLPRSKYPCLAVAPANLVPACGNCNLAKRDAAPRAAEEVFPHPYFDEFVRDRWLECTVVAQTPPAVLFECNPPTHWTDTQTQRVRQYFRTLKLGELFRTCAAEELVNQREMIRAGRGRPSQSCVRDLLDSQARGLEASSPNSWRAAMIRALSEDDWYCSGGYEFS